MEYTVHLLRLLNKFSPSFTRRSSFSLTELSLHQYNISRIINEHASQVIQTLLVFPTRNLSNKYTELYYSQKHFEETYILPRYMELYQSLPIKPGYSVLPTDSVTRLPVACHQRIPCNISTVWKLGLSTESLHQKYHIP